MKVERRYKGIVVPKVGQKILVARDARSGDITFIGGGCRASEPTNSCALREFHDYIFFTTLDLNPVT